MKKNTLKLILLLSIITHFPLIYANSVAPMTPVNCAQLSDDFCTTLYSRPNFGNLNWGESQYLLSEKTREGVPDYALNIFKLYQTNFTQFYGLFPKKYEDRIKKIEVLLDQMISNYNNKAMADSQWTHYLSRFNSEWEFMLDDYLDEEIVFNKFPEVRGKARENWPIEAITIRSSKKYHVSDEWIKILFENHPNWINIEKLFSMAKKYVLQTLDELPKENKKDYIAWATKQINSVELILPFTDPRVLNPGCKNSTINAYYMPSFHKITVCQGLIMGINSTPALLKILAHELAHAIDPKAFIHATKLKDPYFTIAHQLIGSNYSCSKWNQVKKELAKLSPMTPKELKFPGSFPWTNFTHCLANRQIDLSTRFPDQKSFDELLLLRSQEVSKYQMNNYSNQHFFSYLGIDEYVNEDGLTVPNQYYLNAQNTYHYLEGLGPKMSLKSTKGYYSPIGEVFIHSYKCSTLAKENKNDRFIQAMEEVKNFLQMDNLRTLYHERFESSLLAPYGIAKESHEYFADWVAYKVIPKYLKTFDTMESKRAIMQDMGGIYCKRPSPLASSTSSKEFLNFEKNLHSLETHGDDRKRRLNLFTPSVQEQLACFMPEQEMRGLEQFSECVF